MDVPIDAFYVRLESIADTATVIHPPHGLPPMAADEREGRDR
ncbi:MULTISPECIES: hypothetical protein [Natrialbaceae]|nr:hypothetical protein [Natronococcus sp. CG52]